MSRITRYTIAILAVCMMASVSIAQPEVDYDEQADVFVDVYEENPGEYVVVIISNEPDSILVKIEPSGGNYVLSVVAAAIMQSSGNIDLQIDDNPALGSFTEVRNILIFDYDAGAPDEDGELFVAIDIAGTLGAAGSTPGGYVEAHSIPNVIAVGGINASLYAGPRKNPSTPSNIASLATSGNMLGSIYVFNGAIDAMTIGGNIGSATDTAAIATSRQINLLEADRIWANIDTTFNGGTGEIYTLLCTAGDFVVSLVSSRAFDNNVNSKIEIAGDCDADMTFTDTTTVGVRIPIIIHGDLPSDRSITVASKIDAVGQRGGIVIAGSLEGDISIGEANGLKGQIIIDSDNTGDDWDGDVVIGAGTGTPITIGPSQSQPNDAPDRKSVV